MFVVIIAALTSLVCPVASAAQTVVRYGVCDIVLSSNCPYGNPVSDVQVSLDLTAPSGKVSSACAFWDGDRVWRVRFSPTETGVWRWRSKCSNESDAGLHGRRGSFRCVAYRGKNGILARGPLRLSANRRYYVQSDGTPFLWLADTAWNGVLKAQPRDWKKYLSVRRSQGFTVVQFVATHWRSCRAELAFTGESDIRINTDFFKRLDPNVKAVNDHGMVAAPVILWALGGSDPGAALSEEDAIRLARYIVARWGAYNVFWILAGDGSYHGGRAERWRRIGRAVFGANFDRLATTHPRSRTWWIADEFTREPWYSMIGYQSGHYLDSTKWLVQGPPANDWRRLPPLPIVNLEPNYEGIVASKATEPFDGLAVRQALYRSLLVSPTAGVSYGHHAVWQWTEKPEVEHAEGQKSTALSWDQALTAEGAKSVKHLADLFRAIKWWILVPDPALVVDPPADPALHVASSGSLDGRLALVHLPNGGDVCLSLERLRLPANARWFDPSSGSFIPAGTITTQSPRMCSPDDGDWLLVIGN